ncbi:MAG: hypothetical protein IJY65_05715 [Clostridia bacterium]|nr:hypothetical protein [Clostridia bacterium]
MKKGLKAILLTVFLLATVMLATSCGSPSTPYDEYNKEGYTVSVEFNANGGFFTTDTDIIRDTYNLSDIKTDGNGKKSLTLISPENTVRGQGNYFTPSNSGYFLAGWYEKDENGNYSRWDFSEDKLTVDPSLSYSADTPVLTLYAAWVPEFSFEFVNIEDNTPIGEYKFNPIRVSNTIKMPTWNTETGTIDNNDFPKVYGYTFEAAYLDADGTLPVGETLTHSGVFNSENATAKDSKMTVYVDLREGNWYRIYTAQQFIKNATIVGCYEIMADLDFAEISSWSNGLMHGDFSGKILGGGHKFKNITVTQTNSGKTNTGLFGRISEKAVIENITFENVNLTIRGGSRTNGATFGLLAGTISEGATLTGVSISGKILISPAISCTFPNYFSIGLVCGYGDCDGFDLSLIEYGVAEPQKNDTVNKNQELVITADGNELTLSWRAVTN